MQSLTLHPNLISLLSRIKFYISFNSCSTFHPFLVNHWIRFHCTEIFSKKAALSFIFSAHLYITVVSHWARVFSMMTPNKLFYIQLCFKWNFKSSLNLYRNKYFLFLCSVIQKVIMHIHHLIMIWQNI